MPLLSKHEWYDLRWGMYVGAALAVCVFIATVVCGLFGVLGGLS